MAFLSFWGLIIFFFEVLVGFDIKLIRESNISMAVSFLKALSIVFIEELLGHLH